MGRLLHARSFGVPQTRNRFFIVATLPDWGDFTFPNVTHGFRPGQQYKKQEPLTRGLKLRAAVAPGCAPHEVVTVAEALSDLPLFDW
jgi:site-specific DNA-cytosine methylase